MAEVNDDAQWIVMLGFIISIILVFLALIVNQSALVGKTTSESVLEFAKPEIQDLRAELLLYNRDGNLNNTNLSDDLDNLSMLRENSIIIYSAPADNLTIHFNDGTTEYNEIVDLEVFL